MHPQYVLVRYGEVTLKGRNRNQFEQMIASHIRRKLKPFKEVEIHPTYGRTLIGLNGTDFNQVARELVKVFGISSFSPVYRAASELEAIRAAAVEAMSSLSAKPETFKVSVRRVDKSFPHDSQEMNHLIGSHVLRHFPDIKVDVHRPDVQLSVEIRPEETYVYSDVIKGAGGLPLGSGGKAMLMLSGGIDSPVAGWLTMKRGVTIEAVHFHSYPYTSDRAKQKVIDLTARLADYAGRIRLHLVPFTDIQIGLRDGTRSNMLITLMRRTMFRITERLAEQSGALAIVTGENLGQVASQTLSSLNAINKVVSMPVLRPLITMEKEEIIRLAEQIHTYELSILPYEDCCTLFVPKNPSTNPNQHVLERLERGLPWLDERIEEAVKNTESVWIDVHGTEKNEMDEWL